MSSYAIVPEPNHSPADLLRGARDDRLKVSPVLQCSQDYHTDHRRPAPGHVQIGPAHTGPLLFAYSGQMPPPPPRIKTPAGIPPSRPAPNPAAKHGFSAKVFQRHQVLDYFSSPDTVVS